MRFVERQSAPTAAVWSLVRVGRGTYHVSQANITKVPSAPRRRSLPSQGIGAMRQIVMALFSLAIFAWSHAGQAVLFIKCKVGPKMRKLVLIERPCGIRARSCGSADAALLLGQLSLEFVALSNAAVIFHMICNKSTQTCCCSWRSRLDSIRRRWRNVRVRSSTYAVPQKKEG
jgi:hypothetical protein